MPNVTAMSEPKKSAIAPKIRVGQRVLVQRGTTMREATVIEDRGPLGVGGRQIVRLRYFVDTAGDGNLEPIETETAAENVEIISDNNSLAEALPAR